MKAIARFIVFAALVLAACTSSAKVPAEGTQAPAFTLKSQKGKDVSLKDFQGQWVVLYFYPKDFTSGCSVEAHNFQEDIKKYIRRHAVIVGVSVDTVDSHKQFCTKEGLDFYLLSDADHKVSEAYGSTMNMGVTVLSARNTFVVDPKGVIRKVFVKVNPDPHSAEVLAVLDHLQKSAK